MALKSEDGGYRRDACVVDLDSERCGGDVWEFGAGEHAQLGKEDSGFADGEGVKEGTVLFAEDIGLKVCAGGGQCGVSHETARVRLLGKGTY